jgi:hypothetical protein
MQSALIIGGSGSGKSEGTLTELVEIARAREMAIVLMDPHGLLARRFMLQLVSYGLAHHVLYDKLCEFNRILAGFTLEQSTETNILKKEAADRKMIMALSDLVWRASDREGDFHAMPAMSEQADLSFRLILFQKSPVPLSLLPYAFRFRHPICDWLIDNCTDEEVQEEWRDLQRLDKKQADRLVEERSGPIKRLIRQTFGLPAFRERCDGHFNLGQALIDKQIIILDGSDDGTLAKQAVTAVYGAFNLQIDQFLRRHFTQTKQPCPVLVCWEEAAATGTVRLNETHMMEELRKCGFVGYVLSQHKNFVDPKVIAAFDSCTPVKIAYNPNNSRLAMEMAEEFAIAKLDPLKVKHEHVTERQKLIGHETLTRKTKGKSGKNKTESESEYERPIYETVLDVRKEFVGLEDQIKLDAQKILKMPPGWRMRRTPTFVTAEPEYVQMLPDPWPVRVFGDLGEQRLEQAIKESQQRPEFKTPVSLEESWTLPETTSSRPENVTTDETPSWTFTQLPTPNPSEQGSTKPKRRRGKGSNGGKS